jgi:tRNA pseudouridine38-40 synthase
MRIALGLEYAGTQFTGWQSQPDGRGVQDALERALAAIAGERIRVVAAGRTDAGVHATLQIAHFDTAASRPTGAWVRGTNAHLPPEIGVVWAASVDPTFHARFDATARHYTYLLVNRPVRPALLDRRVGWYHRTLDVAAMRAGAAALVGTHDFSAFRAALCQAKSPVKTIAVADVGALGEWIRFDFTANAFLHHMIRNIVGALVHVGAGKAPPAWIGELITGRDRKRCAATFTAAGLYFTGADYAANRGLPATRRQLTLPLAQR